MKNRDDIKPVQYRKGIFDQYKVNSDLDAWEGFPELMWGLDFEMDGLKSYSEFLEKSGLKLKEPTNAREVKRNYLYVLERADQNVIGNFLFSEWRYLTHWSFGIYDKYDVDFLDKIITLLEMTYEQI